MGQYITNVDKFIKRMERDFINISFLKTDREKNKDMYIKMHLYVKHKKSKTGFCSTCGKQSKITQWALINPLY